MEAHDGSLLDPDDVRQALSAEAVERVAAYGAPPSGWLTTVAYAIAVIRRRAALRELRASAQRRFRTAKGEAEHALRRLGRAVYEQRDRIDAPDLAAPIREVDAATAEAVVADAEATGVLSSVAGDEARADAEIQAAKAQVDPLRDQETKLGAQREVAEHDLRRAEARRRRVEIELRNLRATIGSQQSLGGPGTELATRLAMSEAELEARRAEVELLEARVADRTSDLARVRRDLALAVARVTAAEEERRKVAGQARIAQATQAAAKGVVEAARDEALIALGRESLRLGGGRGLPAFDAATAAARAWSERAREVALYDAALEGFDREGFRRGLSLLGGSFALILLAFVVSAVR